MKLLVKELSKKSELPQYRQVEFNKAEIVENPHIIGEHYIQFNYGAQTNLTIGLDGNNQLDNDIREGAVNVDYLLDRIILDYALKEQLLDLNDYDMSILG